MKAAVLRGFNDIQIEELEIPPLDVGQILVKCAVATICGAQINEITGAKGPDPYMPHLLGHEGCGSVIDIGAGVSTVRQGQTVVMHWRKGKGIEAKAPKYIDSITGDKVGAGPVATFAEYAIVSENRCTPISEIDPIAGSLLGCAVTTAFGLVNNEAQLKIGQSIVVAGVGGVGLNVVQAASMVSAYPIVAIDKEENKLGMAQLYGATHTIHVGSPTIDFSTVGKGFDVCVDCTGSPTVIEQLMGVLGQGGKLILVGQTKVGDPIVFNNSSLLYKNKTILDSQGGLTDPNVDIPRYVQLYQKGKLLLDGLVTHRFKLERINDAIALMKTGRAGRIALEM